MIDSRTLMATSVVAMLILSNRAHAQVPVDCGIVERLDEFAQCDSEPLEVVLGRALDAAAICYIEMEQANTFHQLARYLDNCSIEQRLGGELTPISSVLWLLANANSCTVSPDDVLVRTSIAIETFVALSQSDRLSQSDLDFVELFSRALTRLGRGARECSWDDGRLSALIRSRGDALRAAVDVLVHSDLNADVVRDVAALASQVALRGTLPAAAHWEAGLLAATQEEVVSPWLLVVEDADAWRFGDGEILSSLAAETALIASEIGDWTRAEWALRAALGRIHSPAEANAEVVAATRVVMERWAQALPQGSFDPEAPPSMLLLYENALSNGLPLAAELPEFAAHATVAGVTVPGALDVYVTLLEAQAPESRTSESDLEILARAIRLANDHRELAPSAVESILGPARATLEDSDHPDVRTTGHWLVPSAALEGVRLPAPDFAPLLRSVVQAGLAEDPAAREAVARDLERMVLLRDLLEQPDEDLTTLLAYARAVERWDAAAYWLARDAGANLTAQLGPRAARELRDLDAKIAGDHSPPVERVDTLRPGFTMRLGGAVSASTRSDRAMGGAASVGMGLLGTSLRTSRLQAGVRVSVGTTTRYDAPLRLQYTERADVALVPQRVNVANVMFEGLVALGRFGLQPYVGMEIGAGVLGRRIDDDELALDVPRVQRAASLRVAPLVSFSGRLWRYRTSSAEWAGIALRSDASLGPRIFSLDGSLTSSLEAVFSLSLVSSL